MSDMIIDNVPVSDGFVVEKSARPRSVQQAPPYISRAPFYIQNPTLFTMDQWRVVAKEPVTRLCIRHVIREISALELEITSEHPDQDEGTLSYYRQLLDDSDDGEGLNAFLSRTLQDAMELPIGGAVEIAPDDITGMAGGLYHVDGATLYPTYDRNIPFVQINPYDTAQRVYFRRGQIERLMLMPRTDLRRRPFQESPVESAFMSIEALSRIYVYYLKQLGDTPMAGILDLMDMTETEAQDWALQFREMYEGIDPLKIPILYDHIKPAKFIQLARNPQDMQLMENFRRFAELVASAFGLSIGDLRLFEHDRVLAGVEASQRVTARSGIGFYAQVIENFLNRNVLMTARSGIKAKFKLGMTGESQAEAQLATQRAEILMTLSGNQPLLKQIDAQKQAEQWKIIDVPLTGLPAPAAPGGGAPDQGGGSPFTASDNLDSINQDTEAVGRLQDQNTGASQLADQSLQDLPGAPGGGQPYDPSMQGKSRIYVRKAFMDNGGGPGEKEGHPFRGNQYRKGEEDDELDINEKPGKSKQNLKGKLKKGDIVDLGNGESGLAMGISATSVRHAEWLPKWWMKALDDGKQILAVASKFSDEKLWNIVYKGEHLPPDNVLAGLKAIGVLKEGATVETTVGKGIYTGLKRFDAEEALKLANHLTQDTDVQHVVHQIGGAFLVIKLGAKAKVHEEGHPISAYTWPTNAGNQYVVQSAVESTSLDSPGKKGQYVHYEGKIYATDKEITGMKGTKIFSNQKNGQEAADELAGKLGEKVGVYPVVDPKKGTRWVLAKIITESTGHETKAPSIQPSWVDNPEPEKTAAPTIFAPAAPKKTTQVVAIIPETHKVDEYNKKNPPKVGDVISGTSLGGLVEVVQNMSGTLPAPYLMKKQDYAGQVATFLTEQTGETHGFVWLPEMGLYTAVKNYKGQTKTIEVEEAPTPVIAPVKPPEPAKTTTKAPEKPYSTVLKDQPKVGDEVSLPDGAVLKTIEFPTTTNKIYYWQESNATSKANEMTAKTGFQHMPFEAPAPQNDLGTKNCWYVGLLVKAGMNTPAEPTQLAVPVQQVGVAASTGTVASKPSGLSIKQLEKAPVVIPPPDPLKVSDRPVIQPWINNIADFPQDLGELAMVKKLGGTTGAVLFKDSQGNKFVAKKGNSADHIRAEELANAIYRAAGVRVPDSKIYETDGGPTSLHRYVEGTLLSQLSGPARLAAEVDLGKNFAVDALLANWDVVGTGSDNILFDKDGKSWRIDNGGSLDFRAQGEKKTFNAAPEELWSMRTSQPDAAKAFAHLSWNEISDGLQDVTSRSQAILDAIPNQSPYKAMMAERLGMVRHVAELSQPMLNDEFRVGYVESLSHDDVRLKATGVADLLPGHLQPPGKKNEYDNYSDYGWTDENGKKWDNLRDLGGEKNATKRFLKMVEDNGGSASLLKHWFSSQAGSTWHNSTTPAFQYGIYKSMTSTNPSEYYWGGTSEASAHSAYNDLCKSYGESKVQRSMELYHAFTYNLLSRIDFPNKDNDAHTVRVYRHEATHVLPGYGIKVSGNKQVDGMIYPRSPYSSVSIVHPAMSGHLTIQHVPWYRIVGTYFHSRDGENDAGAFYADGENEFLAVLHNVKSSYASKS